MGSAPDVLRFDVAVIGAGVLGLAVAQALARKNRSLVLLERNDAFGRETSSRNSEVLHAGIHYPGTFLKSRLCVEGNRLLYAWCRDRNVPHRRIGKLIVAAGAGEEADLEGIRDRPRPTA
jgi:L-2-hydroxyglutarate oxidase LhgO